MLNNRCNRKDGRAWVLTLVTLCSLLTACVSPQPVTASTGGILTDPPVTVEEPSMESDAVRLQFGPPGHRFPLITQWPLVSRLEHPEVTVEHDEHNQHVTLRIPLQEREALWGFGQRFDAFNLRGRKLESWTTDGWNADHTSYFAVPFFISSQGYGLLVNSTGRVQFDLGASTSDELVITIPEAGVELVVFRGAPATITRTYTETVGRPRTAPAWIYRPWMSRNSYLGAYEVNRVVARMKELGMPIGVVVLEAWAEELHNFRFSTHRYPEPEEWIRHLRDEEDVRVINWITSSVWENTKAHREAKEQGFLVLNEDGSEHIVRWLENGRKIDFRQPDARAWWRDLHKPLIEMGVVGFKTDGGEHMPDPFFHNEHPFYYQQASMDAFRDLGIEGITFARSGNVVCAGLGTFWAGDQHAEWSRLAMVIRGGLSTALSGFPLWAHDVGAYSGTPTKELYLRWLQFGVFSPLLQFHGVGAREPWHFDEETIEISRFYFQVRERLIPWLTAWGDQALADGTPILRPLLWHFPDDPETYDLDDQVMLGPDLIVAPVTSPAEGRSIYLPEGAWADAWTGDIHEGPVRFFHPAPLHQLPLFIRAERSEDYRDLLAGAPSPPPPSVYIRMDGPRNAHGIVPLLRFWRDPSSEPEELHFELRNTTELPANIELELAVHADLEVISPPPPALLLPPNETRTITCAVRPRKGAHPGSYPAQLLARFDGQEISSPSVELVIPPRWRILGLLEGGVGSMQPLDAHEVKPDAEYEGKGGRTIRWQDLPMGAMNSEGMVDLEPFTGRDGSSTTFLHTTIHAEHPRETTMKAGFGDCMVAWLNGELISVVYGHRNPERDEDTIQANLQEGVNHLLIKNSRDLSAPHFYFRFASSPATANDPTGTAP